MTYTKFYHTVRWWNTSLYFYNFASPSIFLYRFFSSYYYFFKFWIVNLLHFTRILFSCQITTNFLDILRSFYAFNFVSMDSRIGFSKACLHKFFITHKRDTSIPQIGYSTNRINVTKWGKSFILSSLWKWWLSEKEMSGGR